MAVFILLFFRLRLQAERLQPQLAAPAFGVVEGLVFLSCADAIFIP